MRRFPIEALLAVCLHFCSLPTPAEASEPFLLGPPTAQGPVVVRVGFFLSDINEIDEVRETFEFEGIVTLRWKDERQAFDPSEAGVMQKVYQGAYQFSELFTGWWPQLLLANESGEYHRQGVLLRVDADGSITYVEEIDATAETSMRLRRFPFDRHRFEAIFEVLGSNSDEVVLETDPTTTGRWDDAHHQVRVPQWSLPTVETFIREYDPIYGDGHRGPLTALVVSLELERKPGFMLRLAVFPLIVLVMLSWSVFWMDRASLGDRMDISFIGILTAVAFQIMFSEILPRISYTTVMTAFLYLSFLTMACSVVINLVVGWLDRQGRSADGNRLDHRCRWAFPVAYFGSILLMLGFVLLSRAD